jgi:hypothetical protein
LIDIIDRNERKTGFDNFVKCCLFQSSHEEKTTVKNSVKRSPFLAVLAVAASVGLSASAQTPPTGTEASFLAENEAAMNRMMTDMAAKPSGDVDRDFVAMMVPHHQGAIEMAKAFLRYGHNEQLRRLAQEIIVTQQQEIVTMRLAVGEPSTPASSSQETMPGHSMSHDSMHMK